MNRGHVAIALFATSDIYTFARFQSHFTHFNQKRQAKHLQIDVPFLPFKAKRLFVYVYFLYIGHIEMIACLKNQRYVMHMRITLSYLIKTMACMVFLNNRPANFA